MLAPGRSECRFIKLVIYFHAAVIGTGKLLGLDNRHALAFPFGVIMIPLSLLLFPNPSAFSELGRSWVYFDYTYCVGMPLLLFSLAAGNIHVLSDVG
ncbi:UNVERIFIED_CONTAM: hypothetical protein ABID98_001599 [Brevibacillus sp. OAP136]